MGQLISGLAADSYEALEADSYEAGLSNEQKLKAERLKRAKMFVAMLKPGPQAAKQAPRMMSITAVPVPVIDTNTKKLQTCLSYMILLTMSVSTQTQIQ